MSRSERISRIRAHAGSKGGKTTLARRGKDFLREIATQGGQATLIKYGVAYYSHQLGKKPIPNS